MAATLGRNSSTTAIAPGGRTASVVDVSDGSDAAEPTSPPARVRKFDRPPPPHDWRWWVGGLGKTLIAAGILMFGFVAYQLWGTGIETARAQNALESEFEKLLAATPAPSDESTSSTTAATTAPTTTEAAGGPQTTDPATSIPSTTEAPTTVPGTSVEPTVVPVSIEEGDPIARIEMPTIGVDNIVVAGVDKSDLKKGPGHYPETPLPGQLGNAAIAGHRTTYGQPFFNVDKLETGDEIVVTTLEGRFVYRVTGQRIVSPSDYEVVATTDPTTATLTLTSCHPKYTARERIIIFSELDPTASTGAAAEPVINYGRPIEDTPPPEDEDPTNTVVDDPVVGGSDGADEIDAGGDGAGLGSEAVNTEIADAFSDGWFSDPGANSQVLLWGLALAAVGILSYLLSRRTKRDWVGLTVGIVPFLVVLYFFFQNVNRLLPPNL
jgi:sortase A